MPGEAVLLLPRKFTFAIQFIDRILIVISIINKR